MKLNLLLLVAEAERLKAAEAAFEAARPALYAYAYREPGPAPEAIGEPGVAPAAIGDEPRGATEVMYCIDMTE